MSQSNSCSFCHVPLIGQEKIRFRSGPRNIWKLLETLVLAANTQNTLIPKKNGFSSCSNCHNILLEISNNYHQLQRQLLKIKAIILQNLERKRKTTHLESGFLKEIAKDLNPLILLRKVKDLGPEPCLQIQIKEEIDFAEDLTETENYEDFGEIHPDPGLQDKIKLEQGQSSCQLGTDRQETSNLSDDGGNELIEEDLSDNSPDWKPDLNQESTAKCLKPRKTRSNRNIPSPLKEERSSGSSSEEEPENSTRNSPEPDPERKRRERRQGYKKRARIPILDDKGQILTLIANPNGSYSFGGILMIPIHVNLDKTYRRGTERKRFAKFRCGKCTRIVTGVYNIKGHIKQAHMGLERYGNKPKKKKYDAERGPDGKVHVLYGIQIITTENQFQCGSCLKIFEDRPKLFYHIRHIHANIPRKKTHKTVYGPKIERISNRAKTEIREDGKQILSGVEIIQADNGTWSCGACGRVWNQRGNVLTHIKKCHPDSTPYHCTAPECGASFASRHLLNIHSVKHANDKPWVCDRCGASCKRKESLNDHILRVHLGHVRFQCPVPTCAKQFFGRYDCIRHMKMHRNEGWSEEDLKEIKLT